MRVVALRTAAFQTVSATSILQSVEEGLLSEDSDASATAFLGIDVPFALHAAKLRVHLSSLQTDWAQREGGRIDRNRSTESASGERAKVSHRSVRSRQRTFSVSTHPEHFETEAVNTPRLLHFFLLDASLLPHATRLCLPNAEIGALKPLRA
jgi:hypothetical protein